MTSSLRHQQHASFVIKAYHAKLTILNFEPVTINVIQHQHNSTSTQFSINMSQHQHYGERDSSSLVLKNSFERFQPTFFNESCGRSKTSQNRDVLEPTVRANPSQQAATYNCNSSNNTSNKMTRVEMHAYDLAIINNEERSVRPTSASMTNQFLLLYI
ncbi:hypothetical protein HELRODRAFT_168007 [Helobdella robusta]|uniref:Uncharacterized protein n=1 Tax=Helobdella robusta TaxID=6412 RepID=T1F022_HELRO|nr:hypothetical protein HELRODRAFT_168007 [Helobdella robusta]ESO10144.1 hypothetical protein HELRODRAFT_168007 [Helobdella robusta]